MIFRKTIEERFREWFIDPNSFSDGRLKFFDQLIEIEEYDDNDSSFSFSIKCNSSGNKSLYIKGEKATSSYLKNFKSADIIILVFESNRDAALHIMECKRTISRGTTSKGKIWSKWLNVKEQFLGALAKALHLQSIFEVEIKISSILFYTIYTNSIFDTLTDSQAIEGQSYDPEMEEWVSGEITLSGTNYKFMHKNIKADFSGKCEIDLTI
jgi:hypothetical protein